MIFTVGIVVVNDKAFVDPRLDTATPIIRGILNRTAQDPASFAILTVNIVPESKEEILSVVRGWIQTSSVDWIVVVGGTGFEQNDYTPEASLTFAPRTTRNPTYSGVYLTCIGN